MAMRSASIRFDFVKRRPRVERIGYLQQHDWRAEQILIQRTTQPLRHAADSDSAIAQPPLDLRDTERSIQIDLSAVRERRVFSRVDSHGLAVDGMCPGRRARHTQ